MTQDAGLAPVIVTPAAAGPASGPKARVKRQKAPGEARWVAMIFLAPAALFLGAIVLYPFVYTLVRSFLGDGPTGDSTGFVGFKNYSKIFDDNSALKALENNIIWVAVVPAVITILGMIFAVLSERIRWATVFKIVLFMPMAISFLASGVTWTLIYSDQPSQGLGNAVVTSIHDTFSPNTSYPDVHTTNATVLTGTPGKGYTSVRSYSTGSVALLPLAGLNLQKPPSDARQAARPSGSAGLSGVVWNDFKLGGGGTKGQLDNGEVGIPGLTVQARQNGKVVASTHTAADGSFTFATLKSGDYQLSLPKSDFTKAYGGIQWLGKDLITPAIILAYIWIYAGFAMVLLAAGMAAIPRDALEAARMDGATEWQVFRLVTAPLLAPVLMVVFVTMVINVLKVFDLVYIISASAGGTGKDANVLATQLYTDYSTQKYGAASAVGIVLVILVLPAMAYQIRRFRKENR